MSLYEFKFNLKKKLLNHEIYLYEPNVLLYIILKMNNPNLNEAIKDNWNNLFINSLEAGVLYFSLILYRPIANYE